MSSYSVVGFTSDRLADLENFWTEFLEDEAAVDARRERFRWLTEQNPSLDGDFPYYLLLDSDRLVGMHGHMPQRFSVNGERVRFQLAHDDLLAEQYSKSGLGKVMIGEVSAKRKSCAAALWQAPSYRETYAKCGWTEVSGLVHLVLVIDPSPRVHDRLGDTALAGIATGLLRQGLAVRDALRRVGRSADYPLTDVARFDERFDALFDRAAPTLGIAAVRDADYLNWKFVDKPRNRYRRLAALDSEGEVRGYVVVSCSGCDGDTVGRIVDLLGDPDHPEALDVAVRQAIDWLQSQGASTVSTVGSPSAIGRLARFGFATRASESGFMIIHWEARLERDFATDIRNWYVTASDADGDAWDET